MHWNSATKSLLALACAAAFGCGPSNPGTMNVHVVDGPDAAWDHVMLQVKKVEIHGPSGWVPLADFTTKPPGYREFDLLRLRGGANGVKETLVDGKGLEAGHYDQMRLLLGSDNTVTPAGTITALPLKVPSGMQSGVKFPVSFDVASNTTRDVFVDIDANRSIFLHTAGHSDQYLLRPVIHAVDRLVTGAITGRLTDAAGGAPLAGVTVMAETMENGHPVIVQTAFTSATGDYVLDLLPAGFTYWIVAQPVLTTAVYAPKASAALPIAEASATQTWSASFDAVGALAIGNITGTITQPVTSSDQTDTVDVLATFSGTPLIVRTVGADATSLPETYTISNLPTFGAGYTLVVERATVDSGGTTVAYGPPSAPPVLAVGATTLAVAVDLAAP